MFNDEQNNTQKISLLTNIDNIYAMRRNLVIKTISIVKENTLMQINDKLIKPIYEVNYLRAENVDRYRLIIRYFF